MAAVSMLKGGAPHVWDVYFDSGHQATIVNNDGRPINDDLHQQLDLPHPAEKGGEEHGNSGLMVSARRE